MGRKIHAEPHRSLTGRHHLKRSVSKAVVILSLLTLWSMVSAQPAQIVEKLRVAARTATWTVEPGEYLYAICRHLTGGATIQKCVADIYALNPHAFFNGDPSRLVPGARLAIPTTYRNLLGGVVPSPAETTTPPAPMALALPTTPPAIDRAIPPPYRDALIGGAAADEDPIDFSARVGPGEPGQRSVSVEYAADTHQNSGRDRAIDQSLALQYRRETENWGEWAIDATGRQSSGPQDARFGTARSGARATLYHNAFPLSDRWIADSALGVIRSPLNPLVTNSFRLTLPSPLYAGLSTHIGDGTREFHLAAGELGALSGFGGSGFDTTSGRFASAGANWRWGEQWRLGVQSMHLDDAQARPDHHSFAATIVRERPDNTGKWSLHALADSQGHRGVWTDADLTWERTRHRFGAYHLDPGLMWSDAQLANDQRGFYWRADQRGLRQSLFGGINYADSNLERVAGRGGQKSVDGFAGVSLRIDRTISVGATLSLQAIEPHSATGAKRKAGAGSAFVNFNNIAGATRLDVARYLVRPEQSANEYVDSLGISQEWPQAGGFAISSAINASREHGLIDTTRRQSLSIALRSPLLNDFHWDLAMALARVTDRRGTEQNVNASLSSHWQVSRNWQTSAQLVWNTIDPAPPLPGATTEIFKREKRLLLTLRYERTSGAPFASLGVGRVGTGRIAGVVFFDENGDGIHQANERGASNLTVFLDGRMPVTTDSLGRYQFTSVPTGAHTLVLAADALPLPWTLEDESGIRVLVPLRGEVTRDIPLTRLRP